MEKSIKPSEIKGTVQAPASKSMLQRAIAAALLSEGSTKILNPTYSNDANAALRVIAAMGAEINAGKEDIVIKGGMKPTGEILNCGEAGLSIRMFSPIAALWHKELTLTGEGSLLSRPVSMIETPLKSLGIAVTTTRGRPPLTVKGPLLGGDIEVDGSVSSQFLTGLLMALPKAPNHSRLTVKNLK
ncbi:MAG: 3-phosphoshikimate 1-carboxyvinyltransferase, partial [bacterium]|nr:3-phosphoshikimate 1-carboxyvinyltransferase [bacterium]